MNDEPRMDLKGHIIICGLGPTARYIIGELNADRERQGRAKERTAYVIIERSKEHLVRELGDVENVPHLIGDATDDDLLKQAGIETARGIFPALPSEKDNVYITIAARQMNPEIRIVASTADLFSIGQKLTKAGANSVISPNFIGGLRLVSELVRPNVTAFLDELLRSGGSNNMQIFEIRIRANSELCGTRLRFSKLPERTGLMIVAMLKKGESQYIYNPGTTTVTAEGDTLVAIGNADQVKRLRKIAYGE